MTATEFLKEKKRLSDRQENMPLGAIFLVWIFATLAISGVTIHLMGFHHLPGLKESLMDMVGVVAIPLTIGFLIVKPILKRRYKSFIESHPEMKHLDEWVFLMGSPNNYPADEAAKIAFVPEAFAVLERYARGANTAFKVRDINRQLRDRYPENSFQWASLDHFCEGLAKRAEEVSNREYNDRWYLLVGRLDLRVRPNKLQVFREQFQEDDPLWSIKIA